MQEGENWILSKEINANRFFSENLEKPLLSLYGTEWRERVAIDSGISSEQVGAP